MAEIVTALAQRLPYGRSISAGLAGLGLGVATLGLVPSVPTSCAGMFVAGMALTAANIGANTAIMKLVPLEILGRVGGTLESEGGWGGGLTGRRRSRGEHGGRQDYRAMLGQRGAAAK